MSEVQTEFLLDIPYYQQTRTATCGPACLMMVLKYWDPQIDFSRRFEFYLWRKSFSLFLFGGTFQFGLASAVAALGFKAEIYQKGRFSEYYPNFHQLAGLVENIISHKSHRLNIPTFFKRDTMDVINDSLHNKIPPIVFLNLKPLLGENVFHWVVVTGLDQNTVYMNDPYVPSGSPKKIKKGIPVPLERFQKAIATDEGRNLRLPPCLVLVYK